jgi:hypothetical protein
MKQWKKFEPYDNESFTQGTFDFIGWIMTRACEYWILAVEQAGMLLN